MKYIKVILLIVTIASLSSCGDTSTTFERVSSNQQSPAIEADRSEKADLKKFSKEDVARYAMSSIMGQPSKKIKVRFENGLYYVSYVRKSDSKKFNYKIKFTAQSIVWANIDGRWRDSEYDERISFEETNNKLRIMQTFSDGSVDTKEFKNGE